MSSEEPSLLRRLYAREVLGRLLDHGMRSVDPVREEMLSGVSGRVVEIGFGTGASLPFYTDAVSELVAVEPAEGLADRARDRLRRWGRRHELVIASASRPLPLDQRSFDVAVILFVLCSVRDVTKVLEHTRALVRPGGRIVLAEHILSASSSQAAVQRAIRPVWMRVLDGCDPARKTRELIRQSGLDDRLLVDRTIPLMYPVSSGMLGVIPVE